MPMPIKDRVTLRPTADDVRHIETLGTALRKSSSTAFISRSEVLRLALRVAAAEAEAVTQATPTTRRPIRRRAPNPDHHSKDTTHMTTTNSATRYDANLRSRITQGGGDPAMLEAAGVLPSEVGFTDATTVGVEAGLCILSPAGVRKLCAIAPDREAAASLSDFVASKVRESFKVIAGGGRKPPEA
jgi:hypothetical protein